MRRLIKFILSIALVGFNCSCSNAESAATQLKELKATKVIALNSLACAITKNKAVYCWKLNDKHNSTSHLIPVDFGNITGDTVAQIYGQGSTIPGSALESGDYACATFTSGKIMCWGNHYYKDSLLDAGALLKGPSPHFDGKSLLAQTVTDKSMDTSRKTSPPTLILTYNVICNLNNQHLLHCPHPHLQPYSGRQDIRSAYFGESATCVINKRNTLICHQELSKEEPNIKNAIFKRENVKSFSALILHHDGLCFIDAQDNAHCNNQLINPQSPTSKDAWKINLIRPQVKEVTVTESHTCTLLKDGSVYCWGQNYHSQIDPAHTDDIPAPGKKIPLSGKVVQQAIGPGYSCFLLEDESVECLGETFEIEE